MHAKLFAAWENYWFALGAPEALAFTRITTCALCLLIYFTVDIRPWADVSPVFWAPVSLFHFLSGEPQRREFLGLIQTLWKVSLFTSAIGLATRASLFTAALLGFFVLGLPNCFGTIHHLDGFPVLLLFILSVSRCAEVFTVDRLFWKKRPASEAPSGEFTWPIKIAQVLFLLIFFAAGVSKLRHSGLGWIHPDNMRSLLLADFLNHEPPTRWAAFIVQSDALCAWAAAAVVVVELSALPAIFVAALRVPVLIALLVLQACIVLVMGVYFVPYLIGYALFVPWHRLYVRLAASKM